MGWVWSVVALAGVAIAPVSLAAPPPLDPGDGRLVVTKEGRASSNNPEAERRFRLGGRFYEQRLFDLAIRDWKIALKLFRDEGDREGEADVLSNLGLAYEAQGQHRQAIHHHQQAVVLHLILGDRPKSAQDYENAALQHYTLGEFQSALQLQLQALALRQFENQYDPRLATSLRILGGIYQMRGQYVPAIQFQEEAVVVAGLRGNFREMMLSLTGLGRAYQKLAQFDKAVGLYRRSVEISRRLGDRQEEINALNGLGRSYLKQNDIDQALAAYQQALALEQAGAGDRDGAATTLGNMGMVQAAGGDFKQAVETFETGLTLVQQSGDRQGQSESLADLGLVQAKRGDFDGAVEFYGRALWIARDIGDRVQEATVLTRLGQVKLEMGRLEEAESLLRRSGEMRDQLAAELSNGDTNKTVLLEEQYHTYRLLQQVLMARDRPEEALVVADRARSQSLVEYLVERDHGASDPAPLDLPQIRQLARTEQATFVVYSNLSETQLLAWVVTPQGNVSTHVIDPAALGLPVAATTDHSRFDASNPLGEVMALWANDIRSSTMLPTAQTTGTVPPTAIAPSQIAPSPRPTAAAPVGQAGLQHGYRLLIAPLESALPQTPGGKIIIVPDRELALIPFGALLDDTNNPLVERFSLTMVPSLKALTALENRSVTRVQSEGGDMVVGNPTPMPEGLSQLPGAEREAIAIGKLRQVSPLLQQQATEATIKEQYPNARWLHFATHGVFNDNGGNDLSSWLALAPLGDREDGLLSMGEVFNAQLKADMVVLSACDTGQGRVTGEGIIGLARAFLKAGSSSVIATLWKVPDEPTAVLMETFYQALQRGEGKAEALRTAVLATRSQYPHPRNWAAFVLMGAS